jgi:glycosyltransferase involved in cell wall biosynthesis
MRILHCILSKDFAGSETYCCQLASLQATHAAIVLPPVADSVQVIAKDSGQPAYMRRLQRAAAPAMLVCVPRWWPSACDVTAIGSIVRAFAPDIVHTHLGRATIRAGNAARKLGVAHVATLHLDWRNAYARCDGIICIAEWQRKLIPRSYRGHVSVVWNWTPPVYGAEGAATTSGGPLSARQGGVTFLTLGRLVPQKGVDVLIRAFRKAFPTGVEAVRCLIAGDGPQRTELERLAQGERRIKMLGYVEDPTAVYRDADVYVSAARYEPFGLTILEAMRAGCRLICTRTQGPVEFLAHQPGVAWADVDDVDSLSATLRRAAQDGHARMDWDLAAFDGYGAMQSIAAFYQTVLHDKAGSANARPSTSAAL